MLKLRSEIVHRIRAITDVAELHVYLQNAIELEHATIPVYLTGLFSIKQAQNIEVSEIIRSVVIEEMLHMTIASNVLNAIGGAPAINHPNFVPTFPGPLPMDVGSDRGLIATLEAVSKEQIHNVFMAIEEPSDPLLFPVKVRKMARNEDYSTIGEFYQAIIDKIQEMGESIFTGDHSLQVVDSQWFPPDELWKVIDVDTATRALELIVEQGEGTQLSPLDPERNLAHYYRFAEIYHGRRLVEDEDEELGWSYSGAPIELDMDGVFPLKANAKAEDYPAGSAARRYADQTNYTYSALLNCLHETFNGEPQKLDQAMGIMYELRLSVQKMVTIDLGNGEHAAPPFQFVTTNV